MNALQAHKKRFKRAMYFYNWLETNKHVCDGCGVKTELEASIVNDPRLYQEKPDSLRLCPRCWAELTG